MLEGRVIVMQYTNGIVGADVVLIDGLEPSNVVVSVRHQMDVDFAGRDSRGSVVCYISGVDLRGEAYSGKYCSYTKEEDHIS